MLIKSPSKKKNVRPNLRKVQKGKRTGKSSFPKGGSSGVNYGHKAGQKDKKRSKLSVAKIKPWKIILAAFVIGALGMLYLHHVFATQELLREVQQMEQQYNQARRLNSDYRLMYDRMTGPAEIYEKAKELGFVNGGPAEQIIEVEER